LRAREMSSSKAGARADGSLADNDGVDEADALAEALCETGEAEELGSGIFSRLHQTIEMMKSQGTYSLGSLPFGLLSQLLNLPSQPIQSFWRINNRPHCFQLRDNQRRGNPATHTLALNPFRDLAVPRPVLRHSRPFLCREMLANNDAIMQEANLSILRRSPPSREILLDHLKRWFLACLDPCAVIHSFTIDPRRPDFIHSTITVDRLWPPHRPAKFGFLDECEYIGPSCRLLTEKRR
jgi:hypothetical protein